MTIGICSQSVWLTKCLTLCVYDFDMHSWDSLKEIIRNVETIGADFIHSKGTPFIIRFKGVNKIKHNYNKIKNWIL